MRADYLKILEIAESRFPEIVIDFKDLEHKLRLYLTDKSFIDIFLGGAELPGRFNFHWERTHIDGKFYRYDNYPDPKWRGLESFPYHFHKGAQDQVVESSFSKELPDAFVDFMRFVKTGIKQK